MTKLSYQHPTNPEVRAWADKRYYDVPKAGMLPQWVIDEWNRTHPKRKYVSRELAVHGTLSGYTYHGCREECCTSVWNAYQAEYQAQLAA